LTFQIHVNNLYLKNWREKKILGEKKMDKYKLLRSIYFAALNRSKKKLKTLWQKYKIYSPGRAAANLTLNNTELTDRKIELESLPVVVNFGITSKCNTNPPCVMCMRNKASVNQDLSWRALLRSGYIADSASSLILHGIGEPLLYPHLFDIAQLADSDAMTLFTTNGLLIGRYLEEICENITKMSVSIDAATSSSYKKIRQNDLAKLKHDIKQLVVLKKAKKQSTPFIDISMCLMRSNVNEAVLFVEMGAELQVDTVHFYHMNMEPEYDWRVGWFDYQREHCHLASDEHDRAIIKAIKQAKHLKMPVIFDGKPLYNQSYEFRFADNLSEPPLPANVPICSMPWRNIQINSDGTLMNCCYQRGGIGSLEESTFAELWNGECQKAIRKGIVSGKLHKYCKDALCPAQGRI
jgi:MoaA/NifB/PqqE/SkfB family radical SAM enzyme